MTESEALVFSKDDLKFRVIFGKIEEHLSEIGIISFGKFWKLKKFEKKLNDIKKFCVIMRKFRKTLFDRMLKRKLV